MRESQKMRLDYRLHMKIIDSIIMIQRWFKTISQRGKFSSLRSAAIKIQSCWRGYLAQKQLAKLRMRTHAAIVIQATYKMFVQRKWYKRLLNGIVVIQGHIRGAQARERFKSNYRQMKKMKERSKLRTTQSLPVNDKPVEKNRYEVEMKRSQPKLSTYGLDIDLNNDVVQKKPIESKYMMEKHAENESKYDSNLYRHEQDVLQKAERQFRNLIISSTNNNKDNFSRDNIREAKAVETDVVKSEETVDNRTSRTYNLEDATKQYFDDTYATKRYFSSRFISNIFISIIFIGFLNNQFTYLSIFQMGIAKITSSIY